MDGFEFFYIVSNIRLIMLKYVLRFLYFFKFLAFYSQELFHLDFKVLKAFYRFLNYTLFSLKLKPLL